MGGSLLFFFFLSLVLREIPSEVVAPFHFLLWPAAKFPFGFPIQTCKDYMIETLPQRILSLFAASHDSIFLLCRLGFSILAGPYLMRFFSLFLQETVPILSSKLDFHVFCFQWSPGSFSSSLPPYCPSFLFRWLFPLLLCHPLDLPPPLRFPLDAVYTLCRSTSQRQDRCCRCLSVFYPFRGSFRYV